MSLLLLFFPRAGIGGDPVEESCPPEAGSLTTSAVGAGSLASHTVAGGTLTSGTPAAGELTSPCD